MNRSRTLTPEFDYTMLVLITALVGFGLVMMFSASYDVSYTYKTDVFYFVKHQLVWLALGLLGMGIALSIDYHTWQAWAVPILAITLVTLLLLLAAGAKQYGSTRTFFNGRVQPSEFAKLAIVIYVATWLSSKGTKLRSARFGLFPFAVLLGLLVSLILMQPDIDTSVVIVATAIAMFFIAGADLRQVGIVMVLGLLTFGATVLSLSYGKARVTDYIAALTDPTQVSNQHIITVIEALRSGGILGKGLAESTSKLNYRLPMAHTDSIFAVIGEELGLLGALAVLGLFIFFAYRGIRIALKAPESFGTLLAFGITTWLVVQALINIGAMTGVLPVSGMTLPFFSYGGSSTLANLIAVGVLLNVSRGGRGGLRLHAISRLWRRNGRSRVPDSGSRRSTTQPGVGPAISGEYARSIERRRPSNRN